MHIPAIQDGVKSNIQEWVFPRVWFRDHITGEVYQQGWHSVFGFLHDLVIPASQSRLQSDSKLQTITSP